MEAAIPSTESLVAFRNTRGAPARGTLLHLTRNVVVFEVYNPYSVVQMSEVLRDLKIMRGEHAIYHGRAVVSNIVATGLMLIVSATLVDGWSDLAGLAPGKGLREEVSAFVKGWETAHQLRPSYQLAVGHIRSFLGELARWLEQVEVFSTEGEPQSESSLRQYMEEVEAPLNPKVTDLFFAFEREAGALAPEESIAHRTFARRELHPFILCSTFVHRSFSKPLGYAGDYEMVNMMLNAPLEGASLYAKIVNAWCLRQGAPAAHRNRIDMLIAHLEAEARGRAGVGRRLRILNVGCGPAFEIQKFIERSDLCQACDFTLMDFNEETIAYAQRKIRQAAEAAGRSVNISFVHKSVDDLLKEVAGLKGQQQPEIYDFVYCAGLFDYLSDRTCKRLLQHFLKWATPGGLVVATNVHSCNPVKYFMEHLMEWHLIYRDEARINALAGGTGLVKTDATGINVFLELRKPSSGELRQ